MAMTITSVQQGIEVSENNATGLFPDLVAQLLTRLRSALQKPRCDDEAIAILGDGDASPDLRDWAERRLCGMTGADPAAYLESRRWQT